VRVLDEGHARRDRGLARLGVERLGEDDLFDSVALDGTKARVVGLPLNDEPPLVRLVGVFGHKHDRAGRVPKGRGVGDTDICVLGRRLVQVADERDRAVGLLGACPKACEHEADVLVLVRIERRVDRRHDRVDDDESRLRLVDEPLERGDVARQLYRVDPAQAVVDDLVDAGQIVAGGLDPRSEYLLARVLEADDDDVAGFTAEQVAAGQRAAMPASQVLFPSPPTPATSVSVRSGISPGTSQRTCRG
jgi:hypothetical protein